MAHIKQVPQHEAQGVLERVYHAATGRAGGVAKIIQVMSQDAESAQGSMRFYVSLMKSENALSEAQREMLAAVTSNFNNCYY